MNVTGVTVTLFQDTTNHLVMVNYSKSSYYVSFIFHFNISMGSNLEIKGHLNAATTITLPFKALKNLLHSGNIIGDGFVYNGQFQGIGFNYTDILSSIRYSNGTVNITVPTNFDVDPTLLKSSLAYQAIQGTTTKTVYANGYMVDFYGDYLTSGHLWATTSATGTSWSTASELTTAMSVSAGNVL